VDGSIDTTYEVTDMVDLQSPDTGEPIGCLPDDTPVVRCMTGEHSRYRPCDPAAELPAGCDDDPPCVKCQGEGACQTLVGSGWFPDDEFVETKVGCGSCNAEGSCRHRGDSDAFIGSNSCNGRNNCMQITHNVGDNSCNGNPSTDDPDIVPLWFRSRICWRR